MLLTGCDLSVVGIETNPYKDLSLSTKAVEYVEKGNDFSLNFLEKACESSENSFVISPLSLQFLLGMILDGAQGQTADEICNVLGYGAGETDSVNDYCKSMLTQLPKLDGKTTLKIANAILVDKRGELLDSYRTRSPIITKRMSRVSISPMAPLPSTKSTPGAAATPTG